MPTARASIAPMSVISNGVPGILPSQWLRSSPNHLASKLEFYSINIMTPIRPIATAVQTFALLQRWPLS